MCQAQGSVIDLQKSPFRGSANMVAKRKRKKENWNGKERREEENKK
jgi:hypothetical protein